jgi:hypothetical protein
MSASSTKKKKTRRTPDKNEVRLEMILTNKIIFTKNLGADYFRGMFLEYQHQSVWSWRQRISKQGRAVSVSELVSCTAEEVAAVTGKSLSSRLHSAMELCHRLKKL